MAKRDRHDPSLPAPWRQRKHLKHLPANAGGVNCGPGRDDGWIEPPGVDVGEGNVVKLLKDGQALKYGYDAMAAAKKRIYLEFYIWDADETGHAYADLLCKKATEGVKVFVIYDSFGTLSHDRAMFLRMKKCGVKVQEFHPIRPWETRFGWRPLNRDHRKIICVDDHIAGVGGMNIANAYAGSWVAKNDLDPSNLWRDTGMAVEGPAAKMFREAFRRTWRYIRYGGKMQSAEFIANVSHPRRNKGRRIGRSARLSSRRDTPAPTDLVHGPIGLIASAPSLSTVQRPLLHALIACAKRSIRMTMAYFAPDDLLVEELCVAARRGVKVQLMFGAKSDLPIMVTAARAFYARLLEAGVRIYERQWVILHAKTVEIDEEFSVIGSTNLDYRSVEFNLEVSAVVHDKRFGRQMHALFNHDMRYAVEVERAKWQKRPVGDRLVQWAVSRMRYLL